MTIAERIQAVLDYSELNANAFSVKIGTKTPQAVRSLLKGYTKTISSQIEDKILEAFPEIRREWLILGEGEMLMPRTELQTAKKNCVYLPLLSLDSVGGLHSYNAENGEEYTERFVPVPDAKPKDVLIPQSGTSMSPAIPPGALLQIRKVEEWKEYIGYGNVFVLVLKDGRRITKEIRRYDADPKNYFWCVSYNPNVADEELPKSLVEGVFQVIRIMIDKGW